MRRAFFMRYSFPKKEHLTKKEHFDGLHVEGRGVKAFPFSLRYMGRSCKRTSLMFQVPRRCS